MRNFETESRDERPMLKTSFFSQWLIFCLVVISLSSVAIVFIVKYTGLFWLYWFMIFSPLICAGIIFNSREIVNQTKVVIYEWRGRRMRPFLPGIYFPFRFFSFLSEGIEVPTNLLVLHIFSGSRDGLADIKKYGSPDNLLPKKGGAIRLGYDITCRIINPTKFVYSYYSEAYTQISNLVEKEVTVWVNNQEAEFVYNNFTQENWQELVIKKLASLVEEQMGVILMSFIPKGIKDAPEVEANRLEVETKKRQGELLKIQLENQAFLEEIAQSNSLIYQQEIKTIMETSHCSAKDAMDFLNRQKTLDTVEKAAATGHLTYMDSSNSGNLTQGVSLGYGFNVGKNTK